MRALALGSRAGLGISRSEAVSSSANSNIRTLTTFQRLHAACNASRGPTIGFSDRSMGQKSIDAFFKRPASTAKAAAGSEGADSVQAAGAAPTSGVEPQAPVASAKAGGSTGAAAAAASPATKTPAASTAAAQLSERQLLRAHANRNAALAKQVGEPTQADAHLQARFCREISPACSADTELCFLVLRSCCHLL